MQDPDEIKITEEIFNYKKNRKVLPKICLSDKNFATFQKEKNERGIYELSITPPIIVKNFLLCSFEISFLTYEIDSEYWRSYSMSPDNDEYEIFIKICKNLSIKLKIDEFSSEEIEFTNLPIKKGKTRYIDFSSKSDHVKFCVKAH